MHNAAVIDRSTQSQNGSINHAWRSIRFIRPLNAEAHPNISLRFRPTPNTHRQAQAALALAHAATAPAACCAAALHHHHHHHAAPALLNPTGHPPPPPPPPPPSLDPPHVSIPIPTPSRHPRARRRLPRREWTLRPPRPPARPRGLPAHVREDALAATGHGACVCLINGIGVGRL